MPTAFRLVNLCIIGNIAHIAIGAKFCHINWKFLNEAVWGEVTCWPLFSYLWRVLRSLRPLRSYLQSSVRCQMDQAYYESVIRSVLQAVRRRIFMIDEVITQHVFALNMNQRRVTASSMMSYQIPSVLISLYTVHAAQRLVIVRLAKTIKKIVLSQKWVPKFSLPKWGHMFSSQIKCTQILDPASLTMGIKCTILPFTCLCSSEVSPKIR